MKCPNPKCENKDATKFKQLYWSNTDTIDELNHSHMQCNLCGYQFNHWHCSVELLKQVFGSQYELYK